MTLQNPQQKLTKKQVGYRDKGFLFYTCGNCVYVYPPKQKSEGPCAETMCFKVIGPINRCGYCMMWSVVNRWNLRELIFAKRPG